MPLEYDPNTSEIIYEGKVIGRYTFEDGVARVSLDITYECDPDEWIVPLAWFACGLRHLEKHKPQEKTVALTLETAETEIAEEYQVRRYLTEITVKRSGYVWRFHKNDPDHWPSLLHGHDYEKHLKLDALTGDIYDAGTRYKCKKLSSKELARIHTELRSSSDFADKMTDLISG